MVPLAAPLLAMAVAVAVVAVVALVHGARAPLARVARVARANLDLFALSGRSKPCGLSKKKAESL